MAMDNGASRFGALRSDIGQRASPTRATSDADRKTTCRRRGHNGLTPQGVSDTAWRAGVEHAPHLLHVRRSHLPQGLRYSSLRPRAVLSWPDEVKRNIAPHPS